MYCLLKWKLQLYQARREEDLLKDVYTVDVIASIEDVFLIEVETGILSASLDGEGKVILDHN
jgi:hypothetical protein